MKSILITGTTNGIGYETAKALVQDGHKVIMANRNPDKARDTLNELSIYGTVTSYIVDLSSKSSTDVFIKNIIDDYDSIDILINNAGAFIDTQQYTDEGFEMTLATNYIGMFRITEALIDTLSNSNYPAIINVSSKAALFGKSKTNKDFFYTQKCGFPAYSASKNAQVLYTKYLAENHKQIKSIAIHPGEVATNIWKGDTFLMKLMSKIVKKTHLTSAEGAQSTIHAVRNISDYSSGSFYHKGSEIEYSKLTKNNIVDELYDYTISTLEK